jgi:hypothetical protein
MRIKSAAALLALPLLAACAPQVESTIHLSDVRKVLASGVVISTPATLRIPQGNEDDCKESLGKLVAALKTLTPVQGTPACVEMDGDEFIEATTAIQIVTPASKIAYANLLALNVQPDADGNIALRLNVLRKVADIAEKLTGDNSSAGTLDPTKFAISIDNDTGADVDALPGEVLLDGKPHLAVDPPITIGKDNTIAIGFNDVAVAYMEDGNAYQFMAVALPK